KAVVESEAHRSAALEKDLNVSRKDVAKLMRSFETAKAEAEASRRQGQDRQKEIAGELATARAAVDEAKAEGARLKAEVDEARKLLQDRDRENAKRIKEVEGLQASLRGANEALERRELELEAEITRAQAALESEAHRSSAVAKDLAKVSRNFESSQAEAEA